VALSFEFLTMVASAGSTSVSNSATQVKVSWGSRTHYVSPKMNQDINAQKLHSDTYDHRTLKTRLPVRSALFKQRTGGLVVRWVTTSEYPLLYVFAFLLQPRVMSTLSWVLGQACIVVMHLILHS
jgi:hypothetical protein